MSRRTHAVMPSTREDSAPYSLTAVITARLQDLMSRFSKDETPDEMTQFDVEAEQKAMRIHSGPIFMSAESKAGEF